MATPDPYLYWPGTPKHWVHVPTQRQGSPEPDQLDAAKGSPFAPTSSAQRRLFAPTSSAPWSSSDRGSSRQHEEWSVAAVALAVAVAAFVLIGIGSAAPDHDVGLTERTSGTSVR